METLATFAARPIAPRRIVSRSLAAFVAAAGACAAPASQTPSPTACTDTTALVIAATTDVHGRLRGWDYERNDADSERGLSRAATVMDSVRAANPGRVILLDAGDLLQGNMLAYVAARVATDTINPIVAAMNAMGYDAAAIGNHEYNYGVPYLERAVRQARFPFLSANTWRFDGSHAFAPYAIVERAGIRVGVVGATTPGVMVWDRDNVAGRLRLTDIVPAVRDAAGAARRAGAQIVVVTVHSGLNEPASYDTTATGLPSENVAARIAAEVPGLALVVYGHSHRQNAGSTIGTTRLIQAKNWAQSVAVATARVARCGSEARLAAPITESALIPVTNRAEAPAVLAATERWHDETRRYVTAPLGTTPVAWRGDSARLRDTPVVDFVLEVMRKTAGAELAGGSAFTFAGFGPGAISIADLARIYPYDNTLRAVKIGGTQLRAYLEQASNYYGTLGDAAAPVIDPRIPGYNFDIVAGADYVLDLSKPRGSRVTSLRVGGREVQPTDSFTIALNNYRQTGGGGFSMLAGAPVTYEGTEEIRVLLERELRSRGTIRPEDYFRQNWRIEPAAAVTRAYEAMHQRPYETERATGSAQPGGRRVRIIATNDFHGALEPRPDSAGVRRGGAAYLATAIARAGTGCNPPECETLLLDGGDEWQGTPASNLAFGRPGVRIFERLGVAASALGNHEFDWGQDTLRARMREARYGIFGANVKDTLGRDSRWIRNDTIVERAGFKVGIIGLSTVETPRTTRAANVADLRFVDGAPIVDSIGRVLRARGADMIVVIAHAGAECDSGGTANCRGEIIDLANALAEPVDAIVAGHTHRAVDVIVRGMPVIEARSRGEAIAIADITPTRRGRADAGTARLVYVHADSLPPDSAVASIVARAVATLGTTMARHIATIASTMPRRGAQYALGNLVADAQRASAKADVAVMNNGGIRADLRAGKATFGALYEVQPFGNTLVRYTVTGATLRRYLEGVVNRRSLNAHLSGVSVRYDSSRPAGSRTLSVTLANGQALRDAGRYTLVMNDFMATGGDGLALDSVAIRREDLRTVDVDALAAYLRARPQPVRAPDEVRIVDVAPGAAR
ncbi:MAG TPA: 5'-nucleotidase C-terminal domain-containing protein [Gemmatimonadaceae bacterium]|nr:5'-nucleotidase C-terminal domain-containing protein [Gemmatimonadaceae bacterium]